MSYKIERQFQKSCKALDDNINKDLAPLMDMDIVVQDVVRSICGEKIGSGIHRSAYEYNLDDRYVVKIEPLNTGDNIAEYRLWYQIQGFIGNLAWVKDWFAPVKWISPSGRVLLMQRTHEKPNKARPDKVPSFLTDLRYPNFGWIGNRFVCHDYAFTADIALEFKKKFKKPYWE